MKKIIIFYITILILLSNTLLISADSTNQNNILIKKYKIGLGIDKISDGWENGLFLKFHPTKNYYLKIGGVFLWNKDVRYSSENKYTSVTCSLINGYYFNNIQKFYNYFELGITYSDNYKNMFSVYDYRININLFFGIDYYFNAHFSIGYKFACISYSYTRFSDSITNSNYGVFFPDEILNGFYCYFYF